MDCLGDWCKGDLEGLTRQFSSAQPFPYVVISNFFQDHIAQMLHDSFPEADDSRYHCYWNPIEKKLSLNDFIDLPQVKAVFDKLQSSEVVSRMATLRSIPDLEADPYLHGAGLHLMPSGGKLDMHLDYSVHPLSGKERRLNLIIYLTPDWQTDWGGQLELWEEGLSKCAVKVPSLFNSGVLFRTSDVSWHGLPQPIRSPEGKSRKSLALYYLSPLRQKGIVRGKAKFQPLPDQITTPGLLKLYEIREQRRLSEEDLIEHLGSDWETMPEGKGYWW